MVTLESSDAVCRGGGTPPDPLPENVLNSTEYSNCRWSPSLMCGVTLIFVPAVAYPAKLVVATTVEAFTLVYGASDTLVNVPAALSFTRIFGADTTCDRPFVSKACRITSAMSPLIIAPLNPSPGFSDSRPVAASTVLIPNELNVIHFSTVPPVPPRLISTPSENPLLVSTVTIVHSMSTWGRRRSSLRIISSYVLCVAGSATTTMLLVLMSATILARFVCTPCRGPALLLLPAASTGRIFSSLNGVEGIISTGAAGTAGRREVFSAPSFRGGGSGVPSSPSTGNASLPSIVRIVSSTSMAVVL